MIFLSFFPSVCSLHSTSSPPSQLFPSPATLPCLSLLSLSLSLFFQLMFSEMFPVWLIASKDEGGFGFEKDSMFAAIVVSGAFILYDKYLYLYLYPYAKFCRN